MTSLNDRLATIGLRHTATQLDDLMAIATRKRWSPAQILEHVVEIEDHDRAQRSLERRLARSRIGRFKPIADFDWAWPTKIDRDAVEAALRLDFLEENRNVVLVAPQGLGKTMIAQNIAHEAVRKGHSVLFLTAAQLLLDLAARDSARALDTRFRHYSRASLLVVDELGYLSYDNRTPISSSRS